MSGKDLFISLFSVTAHPISKFPSCGCVCRLNAKAATNATTVARKLSEVLKSQLKVNVTSLSAMRRRKESVADPRPSSQAIGGVGVVVVVLVCAIIVAFDVMQLLKMLLVR